MLGKLYVVATPIGNLSDITLRALEILKSVDLVLAEDTRVSQKLLSAYDINNKILLRYDQHSFKNENRKLEILGAIMSGKQVALVSDAGTPGISDPGNELVDWLYSQNAEVQIIPIPGASSVAAALSVCGFNINSHYFAGFLPKKKRSKLFEKMRNLSLPVVFFDSPHRIIKTLEELYGEFGDKRVFIGRELTKLHEERLRGKISEVSSILKNSKQVKGEIVVVLEL